MNVTTEKQVKELFRESMEAMCVCACSVVSDSLQHHGLQPIRLLCPWDSPGRNIEEGCHFLLQRIFLTQGLNPHLHLHWQVGSVYH